jgi:hypothetical protein
LCDVPVVDDLAALHPVGMPSETVPFFWVARSWLTTHSSNTSPSSASICAVARRTHALADCGVGDVLERPAA